jgi:hypothetical protein
MLLEKCAPLVVEERAVGLKIVLDALAGLFVFLFQLDYFLKKLQAQQGGLAALPGKDDFAAILSFDVLADVGFQDFVGDTKMAVAAQKIFLVEVVTIGAVEIADGADGFDHSVIGPLRTG